MHNYEANNGEECCCPSQQFHHPADEGLIDDSDFDESPLVHHLLQKTE
jgi:hypothetical protein